MISMKTKNLVALMSRITEESNKLIVQELAAQGVDGIVPSHGGILMLLFSGGSYTMQELAAAIHRTKPTVTVLVDKLVKLDYVRKEKSSTDSRVTYLRLTDPGKALQPVFDRVSQTLNDCVYEGLDEGDVQHMEKHLVQMLQNLQSR